jgi:hypothetical protein
MTGAIRSHVTAARFAIHLRRDLAKNGRDDFPRLARAARHERRAFKRAFFATGDAAAYKMDSAVLQFFAAPLGVCEKRISAVDDDVAFFQQGRELSNDRIHRPTGFHHDHRFARLLDRANEFLHRARRLNIFCLAATAGEFLRDFSRAVKNSDGKSLRFHVQGEVFTHHGQTD